MNLIGLFVSFGLLILAMSIHEFSHGWVAYRLGDATAKEQGRLTLNPFAHIDLVGTILLPVFLYITTHGQFVFGAAKPVPINYWALRNPKRGLLWIGLAGPLANILFAGFLSLILKFISATTLVSVMINNLAVINIVLGVFNLIPIPPLDGSRIIIGILPEQLAKVYAAIEPYGFFILLGLLASGLLNSVIWPPIKLITDLLGIY